MLGIKVLQIVTDITRLLEATNQIECSFFHVLLLNYILFANLVIKLALKVVFS